MNLLKSNLTSLSVQFVLVMTPATYRNKRKDLDNFIEGKKKN